VEEQGYGVREARGEPAQAGQQQQFFDLSGHYVLPGERPENPMEERGSPAEMGRAPEVA
jgi:hypothetical protein